MSKYIWRCHDGRRILITKMEDEHLCNCIDMIKRGKDGMGRRVNAATRALLPVLLLEHKRRMRKYHEEDKKLEKL